MSLRDKGPSPDDGARRTDQSGGNPCPPAFLGSIEECIATVDGRVRPTAAAREAHPLLELDEILPQSFVSAHTAADNAREYFAAFGVTERADLLALPPGVDVTVAATTEFEDLRGMLEAAVEHRLG